MRQEKLHRLWYETFRGKAVTLPYLFKVERIEDQQPRMLPNQDICTSHSLCLALVLANPLACFLTSSGPFLRVNLSKRPLLTTLSKIAVLTPSFSRSLLSFIFHLLNRNDNRNCFIGFIGHNDKMRHCIQRTWYCAWPNYEM